MYVYESDIDLATNASPYDHNLTFCHSKDADVLADTLAVIHENYVNIIPITRTDRRSKYLPLEKGSEGQKDVIKQVKWVELGSQLYFIVLSTKGMHIYDHDITNVVYHNAMKEIGDQNSYSVGICVLLNKAFCIGTHLGTVWLFELNEATNSFTVIKRVFAHDEALRLMESFGSYIVTSSDIMTYMWSYNRREFNIIRKFSVQGINLKCIKNSMEMDYECYPQMKNAQSWVSLHSVPSAIVFKFGLIVVAYTSGEFCFFDVKDEDFYLRMLGHKLKITDMDFSARFYLVTVSIDCFIKVWKYEQKIQNISIVQALNNEAGPLYGVGFLNFAATEFCVVTGDDTKIKVYIDWNADSTPQLQVTRV